MTQPKAALTHTSGIGYQLIDSQAVKRHIRGRDLSAVIRFGGSSQTWLFQTWLFTIFTWKHSLHTFAPSCALLQTCIALFCAHLRSVAVICMFLQTTAFRTTAFENTSLRVFSMICARGNFPCLCLGYPA